MWNELRLALGLAEEQARDYPHANVLTMAVGAAEHVLIETREEKLQDGDLLLLCSDGLTGPVPAPHIAEILAAGLPLAETGSRLISRAHEAGAPDNITVVLIRYST